MLRPDAGRILLGGADITALPPEQRVQRGLVRTFQINALFPHLTALESVTLAVCERTRAARTWWRKVSAYRARDRRGLRHSWRAVARPPSVIGRPASLPMASSGSWKSRWRWRRGRRCCCSTSRPPACRARKAPNCSPPSPGCRATSRCCSSSTTWSWCFASPRASSCMVGGRVLVEGTPHEIAADPQVRAVYLGKARCGKIAHG